MVSPKSVSRSAHPNFDCYDALIDIAFGEEFNSLDDMQKIAQLVLLYDSEVINGGHLQYFHNKGLKYLTETKAALVAIGATRQCELLEQAKSRWLAAERRRAGSLVEYYEVEKLGEFKDLDKQYYECRPYVADLLSRWCHEHESHFVEWTP